MIVTCQFCAKPLELPDVPEYSGPLGQVLRRALLVIAEGNVHEACAEKKFYDRRQAAAEKLLAAKMESIETVIPPLYQDTDETRLNQPWHKKALAWQWGPRGLVMFGDTGTGKTRVAFLIIKREFLAGRACAAYSHAEFVRRANDASTGANAGTAWINIVRNLDLLLIDDFGKVRLTTATGETSAATALLFELIDHRIKFLRPTIVTCNLTGKEIERQWGDHGAALVRRLNEFCSRIQFGERK
jgi:DNA replication protein DnaC